MPRVKRVQENTLPSTRFNVIENILIHNIIILRTKFEYHHTHSLAHTLTDRRTAKTTIPNRLRIGDYVYLYMHWIYSCDGIGFFEKSHV